MTPYQIKARALLKVYLAKAYKLENQEMLYLASKWGVVSKSLQILIDKLVEKEFKSPNELFRQDLYKQLLIVSQKEVNKFNSLALETVCRTQEKFLQLGLDATQNIISLVTVDFNRINKNAVLNMVGLSKEGTPLADLFAKSYPLSVEKLTNTLITSQALGYNPRKTAQLLAENMNGNLTRSLTIARTEQLNCLRMASIEQMKESGVCKGWIRIEQSDCCSDCDSENGKHYSFDESFDTHPNCRAAVIADI
jgi:hypothetical protein